MRKAKVQRAPPVTCEVTPHHLFLNEDDITPAYDTNSQDEFTAAHP